jgi:hypothetical protein
METLRLDALTPEIAPRLSAFRSQCQAAEHMFASSYGSDLSWFAIFHGYHALRWPQFTREPRAGAYPLHLLKQLGYKIKVRLGGDFRWKGLSEVIFGAQHYLADSFIDASGTLAAFGISHRDRLLMDDLLRELSMTPPGGRVFVHEIDSAHWHYSWPPAFQVPYQTYAPFIDFAKVRYTTAEVQLVKHRYLNAVHWADHLFGALEDHLKQSGRFEDSIIIVVGDHGEELYEDGRWGHGSRLNHQQTETPIFVKLPRRLGTYQRRQFLSQVDIMPTIFMALGVEPRFHSFLEGISIDKPRETLLVSSLGGIVGEPDLVFVHPTMKVQVVSLYPQGQRYPDRLYVHDYVDFMDKSIMRKRPPGQTDAIVLAAHFPTLLHQLFAGFAPLTSY